MYIVFNFYSFITPINQSDAPIETLHRPTYVQYITKIIYATIFIRVKKTSWCTDRVQ